MDETLDAPIVSHNPRRFAINALGLAATMAACAFAVTSAVRMINSPDIGYHLAYGEKFLETGKIVQSGQWVWYPLDRNRMSIADETGPGCTYDASTRTYSFVNANWATQVVVAAAYRAGGMTALVLVQAALWVGILALVIVTLRRNGVPWHWVGLPVILIFQASDQRIPLRPEVFGFLFLSGQWALLAGPGFGPRRAIGVVLLQVLAANFHSYFLLGIVLSGAMAIEAWWQKRFTSGPTGEPMDKMAQQWKWLAIATVGAVAASCCNPWFIRGAILPVQTLLYLRAHHVGDWTWKPMHPWTPIREFSSPFSPKIFGDRMTMASMVIALPAMVAMVLAMMRNRWGWALAIVAMSATAVQMHRNLAPAAIIIAPLATIILVTWTGGKLGPQSKTQRPIKRRKQEPEPQVQQQASPRANAIAMLAAAATFVLGAWLTFSVVSNRYYISDGRPASFGLGACRVLLPLDAAEWINAHQPPGQIFSDFKLTSNLMFFTRPHRDMPQLTNTWAMPPHVHLDCVLLELANALSPKNRRNFEPFASANNVGTVVLSYHGGGAVIPLMHLLARHPNWAIVYVGASDIIFVRRNGPAGKLAEQAITPENFDVADYVRRVKAVEAAPAGMLVNAANLLQTIGWTKHANTVMLRASE